MYLFSFVMEHCKNHFRGWEVVHDIAFKAKLKTPNLVTDVKICKHMATILILLGMNKA